MIQSNIAQYTCKRGKVRDVYDIGNDKLVIVATDRISAFDWILPVAIPNKGVVLTAITKFWLDLLKVPNHFISDDLQAMPKEFHGKEFEGRTMLVHRCKPYPVECVVRGYLSGSGWKEYQNTG